MCGKNYIAPFTKKESHNTATWIENFIQSSFSSMHTHFHVSLHRFSEQTQPIKKAPTSKQYSVWIIFVKGPEGLGNQTLKMPVTSERFWLNFPNSKVSEPPKRHWLWTGLELLWNLELRAHSLNTVFSLHQREYRRSIGGNQDPNLNFWPCKSFFALIVLNTG